MSTEWKLAPVEPSEAMLVSGLRECEPIGELVDWNKPDSFGRDDMALTYKALLAAAPAPQMPELPGSAGWMFDKDHPGGKFTDDISECPFSLWDKFFSRPQRIYTEAQLIAYAQQYAAANPELAELRRAAGPMLSALVSARDALGSASEALYCVVGRGQYCDCGSFETASAWRTETHGGDPIIAEADKAIAAAQLAGVKP